MNWHVLFARHRALQAATSMLPCIYSFVLLLLHEHNVELAQDAGPDQMLYFVMTLWPPAVACHDTVIFVGGCVWVCVV